MRKIFFCFTQNPKSGPKKWKMNESAIRCNCRIRKSVKILLWIRNPGKTGKDIFKIRRSVRLFIPPLYELACITGVIFRVFQACAKRAWSTRQCGGGRRRNCFFIIIFPRFSLSRLFRAPRPLKREKKLPSCRVAKLLLWTTRRLNLKPQYQHKNSPKWSPYIFLKNKLREYDLRSKHFHLSDDFINSHNLHSWWSADVVRR